MNDENRNIIFFDATCLLCNRSVQFLLRHDHHNRLYFATLQSDVAKRLLLQAPQKILEQDSIILMYNAQFYEKSNAVLKIAKILGGMFLISQIFYIIPKPLRDYFYTLIARNRYSWFGKTETCIIADREMKNKFL